MLHEYFIKRRQFLGVKGEQARSFVDHLIRPNYRLQPERHPHLLFPIPSMSCCPLPWLRHSGYRVTWTRQKVHVLQWITHTCCDQITLQVHQAGSSRGEGFLVVGTKGEEEILL